MPFHLLWRKDAPERELQTARLLGRALSQLRREKRWMPTIARIEQEAVTQCLGANKANKIWREGNPPHASFKCLYFGAILIPLSRRITSPLM